MLRMMSFSSEENSHLLIWSLASLGAGSLEKLNPLSETELLMAWTGPTVYREKKTWPWAQCNYPGEGSHYLSHFRFCLLCTGSEGPSKHMTCPSASFALVPTARAKVVQVSVHLSPCLFSSRCWPIVSYDIFSNPVLPSRCQSFVWFSNGEWV